MPIFTCQKCGDEENTALCNYWSRVVQKQDKLCSECDPEIGEWHNQFPKQNAQWWADQQEQ